MVDSLLRGSVAALALLALTPVQAQEIAPPPTPNADALATQMRILGSNPRDVGALLTAADLSTRLGDAPAALAFLARAQAVDPSNPRIGAGRASALVLLERPGEALRLFDQAARAGVAMEPYLMQRGLAYDLTGQPGYAQRDYRQLLQRRSDDEVTRRLALSLGVSGQRDEAMALLDPLLRRSDRAAWRARACILAMNGDITGAQKIATSMIPGGAGLAPFFARLPALSAADRAFAVHFGQVTPTVARTNDARLAPQLAALPIRPPVPVAAAPVAVASAPAASPADKRRSRRDRTDRPPAQLGARLVSREPIVPTPTDQPSRPAEVAVRPSASVPSTTAALPPAAAPTIPSSSVVAARELQVVTPRTDSAALAALSGSVIPVERAPATPAVTPNTSVVPAVGQGIPVSVASLPPQPAPATNATSGVPVQLASSPTVNRSASPSPAPVTPAAATLAPPVVPASSPTPNTVVSPATGAPVRTAAVAQRNTDLLAAIVAGISVPASELDVAPPVRAEPPPRPAPTTRALPVRTAAVAAPDEKLPARKPEPKKVDPKKAEPKKPDPAKAEPARWFVQVAGGARAADLDKDWKRLAAKSPAPFRGKTAWTTPLRATNRLLAGPFASQEAAMTFVNQLAKDGSSAFAWRSEAGQKIEKLPTR
jgi:Flp pilus assembly protein TadD